MKNKKLTTMGISLLMALSLCACGEKDTKESGKADTESSVVTESAKPEETETTPETTKAPELTIDDFSKEYQKTDFTEGTIDVKITVPNGMVQVDVDLDGNGNASVSLVGDVKKANGGQIEFDYDNTAILLDDMVYLNVGNILTLSDIGDSRLGYFGLVLPDKKLTDKDIKTNEEVSKAFSDIIFKDSVISGTKDDMTVTIQIDSKEKLEEFVEGIKDYVNGNTVLNSDFMPNTQEDIDAYKNKCLEFYKDDFKELAEYIYAPMGETVTDTDAEAFAKSFLDSFTKGFAGGFEKGFEQGFEEGSGRDIGFLSEIQDYDRLFKTFTETPVLTINIKNGDIKVVATGKVDSGRVTMEISLTKGDVEITKPEDLCTITDIYKVFESLSAQPDETDADIKSRAEDNGAQEPKPED